MRGTKTRLLSSTCLEDKSLVPGDWGCDQYAWSHGWVLEAVSNDLHSREASSSGRKQVKTRRQIEAFILWWFEWEFPIGIICFNLLVAIIETVWEGLASVALLEKEYHWVWNVKFQMTMSVFLSTSWSDYYFTVISNWPLPFSLTLGSWSKSLKL